MVPHFAKLVEICHISSINAVSFSTLYIISKKRTGYDDLKDDVDREIKKILSDDL